jgi:hypothetical protein
MDEQQRRTIIPAQPGWFVWFCHRDGGFAKEPVIAWEIEWEDPYAHNKTTRPITIDSEVNLNIQMNGGIGEVERYLICKPDGGLVRAGSGECETFASEARAWEHAQRVLEGEDGVKLSERNASRNE